MVPDTDETALLLLLHEFSLFSHTVSVFGDIVVSRLPGLDAWDDFLTFE
jgi:hypothetical protein